MNDKTKRILAIVGSSAIAAGVGALIFFIGKGYGENQLIEQLIHQFENGDNNTVVTSRDKNLGNLMYEIKAECIGD